MVGETTNVRSSHLGPRYNLFIRVRPIITLDYLHARNRPKESTDDSNLLIIQGDRGNERNPIRTIYSVLLVPAVDNAAPASDTIT